jgi:hypothetical protein
MGVIATASLSVVALVALVAVLSLQQTGCPSCVAPQLVRRRDAKQ